MAQTYFPFDSGAGANATEGSWTKMAQHWLATGVVKTILNELQVYADSTGMRAKIKSGAAWLKGHYFESDAEEALSIGTADSTNPRIDRIIVRLDWSLNTVQLAVLQGVPATTPVVPTLTQNTSRWEISLAQVYVGAAVSTITAGNITDERNFVKNTNIIQEAWNSITLNNGWTNLAGFTTAQYMKDEFGFVTVKGMITGGIISDGFVIFTLPSSYRPPFDEIFTLSCYNGTIKQVATVLIKANNGDVQIDTVPGNSWLSLSGMRFKVA